MICLKTFMVGNDITNTKQEQTCSATSVAVQGQLLHLLIFYS